MVCEGGKGCEGGEGAGMGHTRLGPGREEERHTAVPGLWFAQTPSLIRRSWCWHTRVPQGSSRVVSLRAQFNTHHRSHDKVQLPNAPMLWFMLSATLALFPLAAHWLRLG